MSKFSRFLAVLAMVVVFSVTSALASPIALKIQSGATTIIVSDNNVVISPAATVADKNSTLGEVAWSGTVGDWTLNVDLGIGSIILGVQNMDLSYNANSTAAVPSAPITLWFTEVNAPANIPSFDISGGGTNNKTSTEYDAYYDTSNGFFATTTLIATSGLTSSPNGSTGWSAGGSGLVAASTAFSVTQKITIDASGTAPKPGGKRIASGDVFVNGTPVPEPSTLLLMGSGLAGLALSLRRRAKSSKA